MPVIDNEAAQRFELVEAGALAFADYRQIGTRILVPHVEAPEALRGKGTAGRLMGGLLDIIRARGQTIVPLCPYAEAFIRRHPDYADLVSE